MHYIPQEMFLCHFCLHFIPKMLIKKRLENPSAPLKVPFILPHSVHTMRWNEHGLARQARSKDRQT